MAISDALVGSSATTQTKEKFKKMLRNGELDDQEIEWLISPRINHVYEY